MKDLRSLALVILTATTVAGGLLAWRQYGELVELRAQVMNRTERADLQKRIWELEKRNRDLSARPAAATGSGSIAAASDAPPADTIAREGRGGDPRGRGDMATQMNAMRALLAKPEVQALISQQQRAGIESRYATLFKNLNLSADQAARLSALLAERGNTRQDVFTAAREQGVDPRNNPEGFRRLLSDAQNEINAGIKAVIGETGFAQLQTYEQTMPQRGIVNELQLRLSYTNTPLTPAQSEQLVQILAANSPPRPTDTPPPQPPPRPSGPPPDRGPGLGPPGGGRGPDVGGMLMGLLGPGGGPGIPPEVIDGAMRANSAPVSNAAIAQAQTVLSPPQTAALQQIQQQQQAQQQLQQMIRETVMPPPANPRPGGTSPGTVPGTPPGERRRPGPG